MVIATFSAEAQRKVVRHGSVLAQLLQVEIARVDLVEEARRVVHVAPHLVRQSLRVADSAHVKVVAVLACADYVQFPIAVVRKQMDRSIQYRG